MGSCSLLSFSTAAFSGWTQKHCGLYSAPILGQKCKYNGGQTEPLDNAELWSLWPPTLVINLPNIPGISVSKSKFYPPSISEKHTCH